ncbi:MAG: hypothetical protein L3J13_01515 [Devosiaceae bacterium]|nr:hypothetical protein [Devosiaceae bacterium]
MTNNINENNRLASAHDASIHNTSARESFSARLLTDPQFDECMAITNIIGREIRRSGKFKDKLGDYAYALSRSEKFDAAKAETILRDLFKECTGQSMNQMREKLVKGEETISDDHRQKAYQSACDIGDLMENGDKLTFHRAFATQAQNLAREFGITDIAAKRIMSDEFKGAEGSSLYDWGKELDEKFFRPQIDAEKQQRKPKRSSNARARRSSQRTRTGPQ